MALFVRSAQLPTSDKLDWHINVWKVTPQSSLSEVRSGQPQWGIISLPPLLIESKLVWQKVPLSPYLKVAQSKLANPARPKLMFMLLLSSDSLYKWDIFLQRIRTQKVRIYVHVGFRLFGSILRQMNVTIAGTERVWRRPKRPWDVWVHRMPRTDTFEVFYGHSDAIDEESPSYLLQASEIENGHLSEIRGDRATRTQDFSQITKYPSCKKKLKTHS